MRIGYLMDEGYIGGQELSMDALMKACPGEATHINSNIDTRELEEPFDAFVVGNCTQYNADYFVPLLSKAPVIRRIADWWSVGDPVLREWLLTYSRWLVFLSPTHQRNFPFDYRAPHTIIPPPIDPEPFHAARLERENSSVGRRGTLWLGHMSDPNRKGVDLALRWAVNNDEVVDFYGLDAPEFLKAHPNARVHPGVTYDQVPRLMASFERFLFLPRHSEAFGRTVIEALAAGCKIVTNGVPGCIWYLETGNANMVTRASDVFWDMVTNVIAGRTGTSLTSR